MRILLFYNHREKDLFSSSRGLVDTNRLDSALQELLEAERQLNRTRSDYTTITRSRFHALRMLWFSFKQFLGVTSTADIYAASSSGLTPILARESGTVAERPALAPSTSAVAPLDSAQTQLIAAWAARAASNTHGEPDVTVVIPAYNHVGVTMRCLQSIADTWFGSLKVQVVLVDDASSDETGAIATRIAGLDYVRNGANLGFVRSCNRGALLARGKYLCFLNNDTVVRDGWLEYLVSRAESDERIGVVGAKLVYPDGTLQEAGGIIWREATGWNYGRNDNPADARYNYARDVDYCSGAALLVRADLFGEIGCFSEAFAPAYYEDVDLCFAARSRGYRVVYEPRAEVIHFEGVSSGTDTASGVKKYQEINLPKFREKWRADLERHLPGDAKNVPAAARRLGGSRILLVIDSYVPMHDKDAGSLRMQRVIQMMIDLGYRVMFLPDNYAALQPYTAELQMLGVEVLHHHDRGRTMEQALDEVLPAIEIAWICRPQLFEKYAPLVRRNRAIQVIYDTIDLHFLREKREAELHGQNSKQWQKSEALEIASARSADATVVVSDDEKQILDSYGVGMVGVIPTIHEVECHTVPGFDRREGILFIGGYNHPPNVDAVKWLCSEIMPLVWEKLPDVSVTLLGSNPSTDVTALASNRIRVAGYVPDVAPYFMGSRVFVAPMRFGAGLKGKVGHSLGFGLPVVTTAVGSEGFGMLAGTDFLLAESKEEFASAIVRLYSERELWESVSAASVRAVAPFTSVAIMPKLGALLEALQSRTKLPAG